MTDTRHEARPAPQAAATLRELCLRHVHASPAGATADETAAAIGSTPAAVRPRFTELKKAGQIRDSGGRRRNDSGKRAVVWIPAPATRQGTLPF